jgi:hypothetical protein
MNAYEIIIEASVFGGVVYGGYVRDLLAGDGPSDIDIRFPNDNAAQQFVLGLCKCRVIKVVEVLNSGYVEFDQRHRHWKVEIDPVLGFCNDETLSIDVTVGQSDNADFDVNQLELTNNRLGKGNLISFGRLSFNEIPAVMKHIRERKFSILPTIRESKRAERVKKMLDKGWTLD